MTHIQRLCSSFAVLALVLSAISPCLADEDGLPYEMMLEHRCVTREGTSLGVVGRGPRESIDELSRQVWDSLVQAAESEKDADDPLPAIVPGAVRTRIEDKWLYAVYHTVRCVVPDSKIHREYSVEGSGSTQAAAETAAADATARVVAQLAEITGTEPTEVGPPRKVRIINAGHGPVSAELCVFRSTTHEDWTVISTYYGLTKAEACAAAGALAIFIAKDKYGGEKASTEILPHEQP